MEQAQMPVADAHGAVGELADQTLQVRPLVAAVLKPSAGGDLLLELLDLQGRIGTRPIRIGCKSGVNQV